MLAEGNEVSIWKEQPLDIIGRDRGEQGGCRDRVLGTQVCMGWACEFIQSVEGCSGPAGCVPRLYRLLPKPVTECVPGKPTASAMELLAGLGRKAFSHTTLYSPGEDRLAEGCAAPAGVHHG